MPHRPYRDTLRSLLGAIAPCSVDGETALATGIWPQGDALVRAGFTLRRAESGWTVVGIPLRLASTPQ